jgi:hypothetical protein
MLPEGDRHIKRQHEIIAELGCNGHNTQLANLSGATRHLSSKIPPQTNIAVTVTANTAQAPPLWREVAATTHVGAGDLRAEIGRHFHRTFALSFTRGSPPFVNSTPATSRAR